MPILDIQMPGMDGHEGCQRFKSTPALAKIPMLKLSSVEHSIQGQRVRKLGFFSCLTKPVRSDVLREHLLRALRAAPQVAANDPVKSEAVVALNTPTFDAVETARDGSDASLLVVEDNTVNQLVISSTLESREYSFEMADNGALGVDA